MSKCKWCDSGDKPKVVDIDGVLITISGKPADMICHAYDILWRRCRNAPRKNSGAWRNFVQQAAGMPLKRAANDELL